MKNILEITKRFVNEINKTNSVLDKKEVLRKYPEMQKMLEAIYNPFKQYYVTSDNLKKNIHLTSQESYKDIFSLLNDLSARKITGHEAISFLNRFIFDNNEYAEVIYNIIDKDLKCRIGDKIINDIYPNCIPTFEVALACKFQDVKNKVDITDGNWHSSRKCDGCLSGDTLVILEKNGIKQLKEVVENKIKDNIKCYNHRLKKVVYEKIVGYGKNINTNNENIKWFLIYLEDGSTIKATENHLFFIKELSAYRRVDALKIGDKLLISK